MELRPRTQPDLNLLTEIQTHATDYMVDYSRGSPNIVTVYDFPHDLVTCLEQVTHKIQAPDSHQNPITLALVTCCALFVGCSEVEKDVRVVSLSSMRASMYRRIPDSPHLSSISLYARSFQFSAQGSGSLGGKKRNIPVTPSVQGMLSKLQLVLGINLTSLSILAIKISMVNQQIQSKFKVLYQGESDEFYSRIAYHTKTCGMMIDDAVEQQSQI